MNDAVRNSKDPKEAVEIMKEYEKVLKKYHQHFREAKRIITTV